MGTEIEEMLRAADEAAVRAGRFLLNRFGTDTGARSKAGAHDHDVVTEADHAAEEMIRAELAAAVPGSVVVGEEGGATGARGSVVGGGRDGKGGAAGAVDGGGAGASDVCWYVDPIDGTHNFSRGVPLWCVSIGLTVAGKPVGGCVYEPCGDELYSASGAGLRRNGGPVPAAPPRPVPMVLTDVPRPGRRPRPAELDLLADLIAVADVRRIGSAALALAYVAVGRADMAVTPDAFSWDVAAGRVLVEASGGVYATGPVAPSARRPGAFAAWRPELAELGRATVAALAGWAAE